MKTQITNQRDLRRLFWETFPELSRRRSRTIPGDRFNSFCADTRMTFIDWIDSMQKDGQISEKLAEKATL